MLDAVANFFPSFVNRNALEPTVLQDRDKRSAIIEDNVLLTEDGCVLISKRQTALIEIPYRTGEEA